MLLFFYIFNPFYCWTLLLFFLMVTDLTSVCSFKENFSVLCPCHVKSHFHREHVSLTLSQVNFSLISHLITHMKTIISNKSCSTLTLQVHVQCVCTWCYQGVLCRLCHWFWSLFDPWFLLVTVVCTSPERLPVYDIASQFGFVCLS